MDYPVAGMTASRDGTSCSCGRASYRYRRGTAGAGEESGVGSNRLEVDRADVPRLTRLVAHDRRRYHPGGHPLDRHELAGISAVAANPGAISDGDVPALAGGQVDRDEIRPGL